MPLMAVATAAVITGLALWTGLVVNASPSLKVGFYRKTNLPVTRGAFILFRAPAEASEGRPYAREPLIKVAAGMEGDRVSIGPEGVTVNGLPLRNSKPLAQDSHGKPMPSLKLSNYVLKSGEVLPMSDYNPWSFDGRYFGPVRQSDVIVLLPVWTWDAK